MILRVAFTNANGTITLVSAANPLPVTGGGGGGGGGAVTVADGADIALGATTDATTLWDGTSAATAIKLLATSTAATTASATDVDGIANTVGGIADTAYSGTDASLAAMIRAIADAAISQAAAATKEDPSATWFDPDVTNALQLITASPAVLTGYMTSNPHATDMAALLFFDAASTGAVTLGTTPPDWAVCLHGADGADVVKNLLFSSGIVVAAIKNFTGSTAPTTALPASVSYRAP